MVFAYRQDLSQLAPPHHAILHPRFQVSHMSPRPLFQDLLFSPILSPPSRPHIRGPIPLPPLTNIPCNVHPLLEASSPPRIEWCIGSSPQQTATTSDCHCGEQRNSWLYEPATHPALPFIAIRTQGCENVMVVFAGGSYVTVLDVLRHIFRAPRCALGASECSCARCLRIIGSPVVELKDNAITMGVPPHTMLLAVDHGSSASGAETPVPGYTADSKGGCRGDIDGWRWVGLRASATERDLWDLDLE
ncbi:hypothetical protein DFP72DRAFT_225054 [Ephemerocybe angulata]|uniref:DUF6699 domain-containing protein n=1 Tax=Ephemerocybe angulata TaxID=980116 RepID=A0A8H6MB86_9AGAR|nr:hypothetical protein DFP72DRAFT_225054 [Tulosesus angulatus]